jgi:hypothetical protein
MAKTNLTGFDVKALIAAYQADLRQLEYKIGQIQSAILDLEKKAPKNEDAPAVEKVKGKPGPKANPEKAAAKAQKAAEEPKVKGKPGPKANPEKAAAKAKKAAEEPKVKGKPGPKANPEKAAAKAKKAAEEPKVKGKPGPKANPEKAAAKAKKAAEEPKVKGKPGPKANPEKAPKTPKAEGEKKKPGRKGGMSEWDSFVIDELSKAKSPIPSSAILEAMKKRRDKLKLQEGDAVLKSKLNQTLVKLTARVGLVDKHETDGRGYNYVLKQK